MTPRADIPDYTLVTLSGHAEIAAGTGAVPQRTPDRRRKKTADTGMTMTKALSDLELQLRGYSLATAEILYRMPDAQALLQSFVWQDYDLAPRFPKLRSFLDFWARELDGPIHSVRLCHAGLVSPRDFRYGVSEFGPH